MMYSQSTPLFRVRRLTRVSWFICIAWIAILFSGSDTYTQAANAELKPALYSSPDHAPLDPRHTQDAEAFYENEFRSGGQYDLSKVESFIARLKRRREYLLRDIYETTVIEKLELEFKDYPEALEDAREEIVAEDNALATGIDSFLLPILERMRDHLQTKGTESEKDRAELDALANSFHWVYATYFDPAQARGSAKNTWSLNRIPHRIHGITIKRESSRVEANNLAFAELDRDRGARCLEVPVRAVIDRALTQEELETLRHRCAFDLSRLQPLRSPLIRELDDDAFVQARKPRSELFPPDDVELQFNDVRHSGKGSVKLNATWQRPDGTKVKYKVKLGQEGHNEATSTALAKMVGLNQDEVQHRPRLRLKLGKKWTWEKFRRQWTRRFHGNQKFIENFVVAHGGPKGAEWVELRGVLLEAKDKDRIRLEGYNPNGWDLPNRRESRALLLFYGWLAVQDTKPGNHVINLVKTPQGLVPEYSLQDIGYSLRRSIFFDPASIVHEAATFNANSTVNSYESSFMRWGADAVTIRWADFNPITQGYETTTYSDLRWMARKIARLTLEDIHHALRQSGSPAEAQELYALKIGNRRDEIVRAFRLESEFPLFNQPDAETYSNGRSIKNGRITAASLEDSPLFEGPREKAIPLILQALPMKFDLPGLAERFKLEAGRRVGLEGTFGPIESNGTDPGQFGFAEYRAGIQVAINRQVTYNNEYVAAGEQSSTYFVRDTIRISLVIGGEWTKKLTDHIPVHLQASAKVFSREYELVSYAPSWQAGWTVPFRLFQVVFDLRDFVAEELGPREIVRIEDSYGFDAQAKIPVLDMSLLKSEVFAKLRWGSTKPLYFYRDSYAELHIYRGTRQEFGLSVGIVPVALDLWIIDVPLVELGINYSTFRTEGELFTFQIPSYEHRLYTAELGSTFLERERRALDDFLDGNATPSAILHRDLKLKAKGSSLELYFRVFFLINESSRTDYTKTEITLADGTHRTFHRFLKQDDSFTGVDIEIPVDGGRLGRVAILKRDIEQVIVEWDEDHPLNSTVVVYINEYDNKKTRSELDGWIQQLNAKFSRSEKEPFFRDYELPEAVKSYVKLSANLRVFVKAADVLAALHQTDAPTFNELVESYLPRRPYHPGDWYAFEQAKGKFAKHQAIIRAMKRQQNYDHALIAKMVGHTVASLQLSKTGTNVLRDWLGEKSFMVLGDIYGVHTAYSNIATPENTAGRRFAGKHWGTYPGVPPLRKFYRDHSLGPIYRLIDPGFSFEMLFGPDPEITTIGPR